MTRQIARAESPLPPAEIPSRFLANLPEMLKKAVAQNGPAFRLLPVPAGRYPEKRSWPTPLSRCLKVDDAALQPYRDSMCPVVCAEFGKDVLDMTFHGFFRDGKLGRDLFVGVSA